jgi:hypothetical protein
MNRASSLRRFFAGLAVTMCGGFLQAKPLFLKQAKAAGMADIQSCIACHTTDTPKGGPWNARGNWLRAEKVRRHAMSIDVAWLKEFSMNSAASGAK